MTGWTKAGRGEDQVEGFKELQKSKESREEKGEMLPKL
jgi:hypothetical protein